MFNRLNSVERKLSGKLIIMGHDFAHRLGGDLDMEVELVKFFSLAIKNGYEFRTVDTYLTDSQHV